MINLEHKLTVDDLIVEYMIYKVENGYEPGFKASEFIEFLSFFESKMPVEDALYEGEKLFQRFFERKNEHDWSIMKNWSTKEKEIRPHMDMAYSETENEYFIRANYRLSGYDKSIINTYFMDQGMGKFNKGKVVEIRNLIQEFLSEYPKRKIDETISFDENDLIVGKYVAAEMITNIWYSYIGKQVENHRWPKQCTDINKYLLEMDLADIIGVESIKKELLDLYLVLSKRLAILYHQDRNLEISSSSGSFLAHSNYLLLIQGYEKIIEIAFGKHKKSLEINLSNFTFKESHEIVGVYDWDDDPDIKTTTTSIGDNKIKQLVMNIEKGIPKNN